MKHARKFKDASFLFITGIEGSGTTMMLKLLDEIEEVAVLGGNYWTPALDQEAQAMNRLTEKLWNESNSCSLADKEGIFHAIRELELPSHYTHVVYKRSFPFLDTNHFPHLVDCRGMARCRRILNMRRDYAANSRSILRREFESDTESAAKRTEMAVNRLEIELDALVAEEVMNIDYENIINANNKDALLVDLAKFIGLAPEVLKKNSHIITGPTITTSQ